MSRIPHLPAGIPLFPGKIPFLPDRIRPLVFAHRGCSSLAPENTMAAFKKARECGAPGIELDIHATKDGKLVVVHDDNFLRTAPDYEKNSKKPEDLDYDEIKNIDAGSFFHTQYSAERHPLLEEVLEEFCPSIYVDIELKSRKTKGDPLPGLLAEKLKMFGKKLNFAVTVSSFNPFCIKTFKREWKKINGMGSLSAGTEIADIPSAIIWSADREVPPVLRRGFGRILSSCDYLKPVYKQVNAFSMFWLSFPARRPVVPWTIDDPALAKKMTDMGCEGIITNRPQDMGGHE